MNKELIEKKEKIMDLLFETDCYEVQKFFDIDSEKMLDEKIEVLTALKEGKTIAEIPKFYDVLELMPKDGEMWD
jgi:hypothetical protein